MQLLTKATHSRQDRGAEGSPGLDPGEEKVCARVSEASKVLLHLRQPREGLTKKGTSQARNENLLLARLLLTYHPTGAFLCPWPTAQGNVLHLDPVHIPHTYSTSYYPSTQRSQAPSFQGPRAAKVTQTEREQSLHLNF